MKRIKQLFIDFRSSTPKSAQWLLLGAAFVVVIILLTLLLGHKSGTNDTIASANPTVTFEVSPKTIDFMDTTVGHPTSEDITVTSNIPVVIKNISVNVSDMKPTHNCDNLTDNCFIMLTYKPTAPKSASVAKLTLQWHIKDQNDNIKTETIDIKYSAKEIVDEKPVQPAPVQKPIEPEPVIDEEPEPIVEPEPVIDDPIVYEEDYSDSDDEIIVEPEPIKTKINDEINTVASSNPFAEPVDDFSLPPEKCSEFAIPGYNQSGVQIGWIKPERGANYFHPFEDTDCSNPTGKYSFNTGIITSLSDGSKIGTDAEHIGYRSVRSRNLSVPKLTSPQTSFIKPDDNGGFGENAIWGSTDMSGNESNFSGMSIYSRDESKQWKPAYDEEALMGSADTGEYVTSSKPYDRTFILRQFKPIPATIVSEVRADPSVYGCDKQGQNCTPDKNHSIPVRATVDRNVFSDDGRTIIIPTGTLLMGYLEGELPGPYQAVGRMNIKWYQFIRPDGVEFNFGNKNQDPYSADAQGRVGVPGHGSTDYVEQMVMPILTSMVPAAVNMIAPIADTVINQINLDNNTIVQSGTIRSSELAKQEVISTWNKVAQKLLVDAIDNTTPPFSIAAGTRINVYSPVDLIVSCEGAGDKKCAVISAGPNKRRSWSDLKNEIKDAENNSSWIGQVRSFDLSKYCKQDSKTGKITIGDDWAASGSDYRTVLMYCESQNYQAKNNAKQNVYNESVKANAENKYGTYQYDEQTGTATYSGTEEQTKAYNTEVLGLTYDEDGNIENPFAKPASQVLEQEVETLTCDDGSNPDANGCCTGETYTDMGADYIDESGNHFACCPDSGGDCFPPIEI